MHRDIFSNRETSLKAGNGKFRIRIANKITLTTEEKLKTFPTESRPNTRISSLDICLAYGHNYKNKMCTIGKHVGVSKRRK